MKNKQLKIWNGCCGCIIKKSKLPENLQNDRGITLYICAYSRADANRLINEFNSTEMNITNEIKNYFNEGCWGIYMDGITPERGLWVNGSTFLGNDKVTRLI